jgi:uncharacterized protein YggE
MPMNPKLQELPLDERIKLVEDIWDSKGGAMFDSRLLNATIAISAFWAFFLNVAHAQVGANVPAIEVSGDGEVLLSPDEASFNIEVKTSANSAAEAAQLNARVTKSVSDALRNANVPRNSIKGSDLNVSPRWDYDEKTHRPVRGPFEATNSIHIQTEDLPGIGSLIDAALTAGATGTSGVTFTAKDTDAARREALTKAVNAARADAESMAKASGGALG